MLYTFALAVGSLGTITVPDAALVPQRVAQQISDQIETKKQYPRLAASDSGVGVVHVSFKLDDGGYPVSICIAKRAKEASLNRAAVQTIRNIGPVTGARAKHRYVSVLQYAAYEDDDILDRRLATEMEQAAGDRLPPNCRGKR